MSDARSDQGEDESKESISDDPEIQAKGQDSNHFSGEKLNNKESRENSEDNRYKNNPDSSEKTSKTEHGRNRDQFNSRHSNEVHNGSKSPVNDNNLEKLESDPGYLGEYPEYSSLESNLRDFQGEDATQSPNESESYQVSYENESPNDTPRGHWQVEEGTAYDDKENLKREEEKLHKFEDIQITAQSSEQETPPLHQTPEKQDETSEFYLSDNQMSEHLSETAIDGGFSDIDLASDKSHKSKHRKRFKSTTKGIESLFHKSSIGKSSKSSKSKGSPTSGGKTQPKDKLLVTTSTSSASKTSKKDKTPCWTNYEITSKPVRKGPTLGVFYDSVKSSKTYQRTESGKDAKYLVLQTPDSLERYLHPFQVVSNYYTNQSYIKYYNSNVKDEEGVMSNYYYVNMMTQRKSLLPYYVRKTVFGNVPGMGRVLVCGTQCGKIIFQSFFTLDELIVLDTRSVYDKYLSRDNSIDPDAGMDTNKALDSTLFEVNCLALINTFQSYSTLLAIGNHLGHLLMYQIPKLQLVKLIYPTNLTTTTIFNHSNKPRLSTANSLSTHGTYSSLSSLTSDTEEVLIDELELLRIRRYKSTNVTNKEENRFDEEEDEVVFITCLGYCSSTGDLWVGYGNATFAIYSNKFKLKYFYNSNTSGDNTNSNSIVDNDNVYSVNNFEYCKQEQIVLVLFGNVKVDIFTFEGNFLSTINCTRLTNDTIPISTIHVSPNTTGSSILYIGLMDGSLLVKQIVYTKCSKTNKKDSPEKHKTDEEEIDEMVTSKIEFVLLYNLRHKFDCEDNFGAPVTSICPVPSQNLVLLGNASGGLSVISNLIT